MCLQGRFANETRSTECSPCPLGFAQSKSSNVSEASIAATFRVSCSACPKGYFTDTDASVKCRACEKGQFTAFAGMSKCGPCPEGRASGGEESTSCEACLAGRYASGEGNEKCIACPIGWSQPNDLSGDCVICPAGTACRQTMVNGTNFGAADPHICRAGMFSSQDGSQTCLSCAIGQASFVPGSTSCTICEAGTFAAARNSTGRSEPCLWRVLCAHIRACVRTCERSICRNAMALRSLCLVPRQ